MNKRPFMCFPFFKDKALTFSYDDGVIYDKRLVELFVKHGLKGTFNLNSALYGQGRRITKEQALELYTKSNMEVAIHGYNHLSLASVDVAVATRDVIVDRQELEATFGRIVKGLAYAYGAYDDKVLEILSNCGVNYARTVMQTENFELPENWLTWHSTCHHNNFRLMELAEKFISYERPSHFWAHRPKLFYVWGHSYEFNDNNNWEVIEKFAEYICGRDDIWYATNGEIYDYVKAYDSLEWSVDNSLIHNPTATDVYINYFGENTVIKAGETVYLKK